MNHDETTPEAREGKRFFDGHMLTRLIALALGISLIVALVPPTARRLLGEAEERPTETGEPLPQETSSPAQEQTPEPVRPLPNGNDLPAVTYTITPDGNLGVSLEAPEETAETLAFLLAYEKFSEAQEAGDYEAALDAADECLALADTEEKEGIALTQRGNALFALSRYGESAESFRQALTKDLGEAVSRGELQGMIARCCILTEDLEEAMVACNAALAESGEDEAATAEYTALRGLIQVLRGDYAAAKADYLEAQRLGYPDEAFLQVQIEQCEELIQAQAAAAAQPPASTPVTPVPTTPDPEPEATPDPEPVPEETEIGPTEAEKNAAVYYFAGEYQQAAETFRSLLGNSTYYTDQQLYANLARCAYLLGDFAGCVENCTAGLAEEEDSERASLYTLRGSAYMAAGDAAPAAADFLAAVEAGGEDPLLNTLQATVCLYFSGDYAQCIAVGTPLAEEEGYGEAALWVALSRYMVGDADAAAWLRHALTLEQAYCRQDELCRLLARTEFQNGNYTAVIEAAQVCFALGATDPDGLDIQLELHYLAASAYLAQAKYAEALAEYREALPWTGASPGEIASQMTLCAFLLGQYPEAVTYGGEAVAAGYESADLFYWLGLAQVSVEDFTAGRETLKRCQSLDVRRENIWFYIGVCSFSLEDFEEAAQAFSASIEAEEAAADRSRYNRSICYLQMEEYELAKEDLELAAASSTPDVAADAQNLLESVRPVIG